MASLQQLKNKSLVSGYMREETQNMQFFLNIVFPMAIINVIHKFYPSNFWCNDKKLHNTI